MPPLKNFLPPKGNPFGNPCEAFVFTRFVVWGRKGLFRAPCEVMGLGEVADILNLSRRDRLSLSV